LAQKKILDLCLLSKRHLIESNHSQLSITRQCELLGLNKSSYYNVPCPESPENLTIMHLFDKQYMKTPFYGVRRMHDFILKQGYSVNIKRTRRLLRLMGLEAIYPKPNLSKAQDGHKIYPSLLKGLEINRINQVWSSDITYLPMQSGFLYLTAIIDWYSRYVLSWKISNSLDVHFCLDALDEAFKTGTPEIFNTDQGSQFTSGEHTNKLLSKGIKISMDGKGRALDNVFIERLWWSLKYEYLYINVPETGKELYDGLSDYFYYYNHERPHQSLEYQSPVAVHC